MTSWRHWTCPGCGATAAVLDGSRVSCVCGTLSTVTADLPPATDADLELLEQER